MLHVLNESLISFIRDISRTESTNNKEQLLIRYTGSDNDKNMMERTSEELSETYSNLCIIRIFIEIFKAIPINYLSNITTHSTTKDNYHQNKIELGADTVRLLMYVSQSSVLQSFYPTEDISHVYSLVTCARPDIVHALNSAQASSVAIRRLSNAEVVLASHASDIIHDINLVISEFKDRNLISNVNDERTGGEDKRTSEKIFECVIITTCISILKIVSNGIEGDTDVKPIEEAVRTLRRILCYCNTNTNHSKFSMCLDMMLMLSTNMDQYSEYFTETSLYHVYLHCVEDRASKYTLSKNVLLTALSTPQYVYEFLMKLVFRADDPITMFDKIVCDRIQLRILDELFRFQVEKCHNLKIRNTDYSYLEEWVPLLPCLNALSWISSTSQIDSSSIQFCLKFIEELEVSWNNVKNIHDII